MERWNSPYINHFISADTIIPNAANPQSWNRYSYVLNNPLKYTDPTGHMQQVDDGGGVACTVTHTCGGGSGGGSGNNNGGGWNPVITPLNPGDLPCGGMMTCGQQSAYQYAASLVPFTSSDACYFLHLQPGICDPGTRNSLVQSLHVSYPLDWFLRDIAGPTSSAFGLGATGLDIAEAMHWVHYPVVGTVFDAAAQLSADGGQGYTVGQEAVRVAISVGEGQVSAFAGVTLAGVDSVPGAVSGPGDVIIIGGSYVVASAATSFWLNELNGAVINRWPTAQAYIPYQNVFESPTWRWISGE